MYSQQLPTGYQWIDVADAAEPRTVLAWDENGQRKVLMTAFPPDTTLDQAIAQIRRTQQPSGQFELVAGNQQRWLIRPIVDQSTAESVLEYPEEWVTGRRRSSERQPMSSTTKRRLAWLAANGIAFSLAFGWDPEWSHSLTRSSYFILGGSAWALAFGLGQWGALRDRLRKPGSWFWVAAFGQALAWFLLYFWQLPLFTVFGVMSLTAFLHWKSNPEAIKNPRRWMLAYPAAWTFIYFILWGFIGGMSFSTGAVLGVLLGMMTMSSIRFKSKGEM